MVGQLSRYMIRLRGECPTNLQYIINQQMHLIKYNIVVLLNFRQIKYSTVVLYEVHLLVNKM